MFEPAPRPLRVLHYPTDVGGNPSGLARAERALGAESTVAVLGRSCYRYDVDLDLDLGRRGRLRRLLGRTVYAAQSLPGFDVFHFNFGQTLLPRLGPVGIDLPLLRAAGKRVFMTFQGCDARQVAYCRGHRTISCCGAAAGEGLCRPADDAGKARGVAFARRFCHRLFCLNPDLLGVVPSAEFVPYAAVDPANIVPAPPRPGPRLTILHAPTNRAIKGTDHVIRAVSALAKRRSIRLELIEDRPHAEAMEAYRAADLVIDQLKIGWYGAFAVEMMAMAKPVVCYVGDEDLARVPAPMAAEVPLLRTTPSELVSVLDRLLERPADLPEIGWRGRAYVQRWHNPLSIARRFLAIYRDPTLPFWDSSGLLPGAGGGRMN